MLNIGGRTINVGHVDFIIIAILLISMIGEKVIILPRNLYFSISILSSIIILSALLEAVYSQSLPSVQVFIEISRWLEYLLILIFILKLLKTEQQIKTIVTISFFCSLLFMYVAAEQALTFNFFEMRVYGLFLSAADRNEESISNPNVAGAYLMGCSLFYLSFYSIQKWKILKLLFASLFILALILMLMTLSRSAFLGFCIGLGVVVHIRKIKVWKIFLGLFLAIGIFIFILNQSDILNYRFYSTFESGTIDMQSVSDRKERSVYAIENGLNNFWFGTGYADFERHFGFLTPDNFYVETFADIGIFGFLAFMSLIAVIYFDSKREFKLIKDPYFRSFFVAFIATFVAFLAANYAANLFRNPRLLGLFWMFTALAYKYRSIELTNRKKLE